MQALEFSKTTPGGDEEFSLSCNVAVEDAQDLLGQFRHVKEVCVEWFEKRGEMARGFLLVIDAPCESHSELEALARKVLGNEKTFQRLLAGRSVNVEMRTPPNP